MGNSIKGYAKNKKLMYKDHKDPRAKIQVITTKKVFFARISQPKTVKKLLYNIF